MRELIHSGQFRGMRGVVLGAGRSGLAAARLLATLGASVRLLDRNPASVDAKSAELLCRAGVGFEPGEHSPAQFEGAQIVVVSPGIPLRVVNTLAPRLGQSQIISELELASWFVSEQVVAITGTNGKTTTTSLVGHILEKTGRTVFVGGNIGTPLSEYLLPDWTGGRAEVLVLEVSSFQLQGCRSFRPHVGVLLNFSANHLDHHETEEEYLQAKLQLFARQQENDLAIVPLEMKEELEARGFTKARRIYFTATDRFPGAPLAGRHNKANMEAAFLALRPFGLTEERFAEAMAGFRPLPHRIEPIGEKRGVLFVDDSKATTVEAMRAAVEAFDRPVRLLAGGKFKGGDLAGVLGHLKGRVASVGLYGGSREVFEAAWAGELPLSWEPDLERAARRLFAEARPGDVILLSPATSSFDQYRDYKHRGDDFQRIFREIGE